MRFIDHGVALSRGGRHGSVVAIAFKDPLLAPKAQIIIFTVFDDADKIFRAVYAGASESASTLYPQTREPSPKRCGSD
jgi:hypothetical protein